MAAKLYSLLESLNISSTASLSVIGTVSSGFNKFYPRKDSYLYYKNDFQVERRFSYGNIGCGLTYSFILENSIAPYGAVLSLNVGSGMTVSNCDLVVDKIISSQIGSNNTPSSNSVLSYDGDDLNWVSKLTIDDIAKFFGTTCGAGYQPVGTYSYDGYKYTLRILCEYIGPPIASTTTTTSTTCAPSDITPNVDLESNIITFSSVIYGPATSGTVADPDSNLSIISGFPVVISPIPANYDSISGWMFMIDDDPCSPYIVVVPLTTTTTTTLEPTTSTTTEATIVPTTSTTTEAPTTSTTTEAPTTSTTTEAPTTSTTTTEPILYYTADKFNCGTCDPLGSGSVSSTLSLAPADFALGDDGFVYSNFASSPFLPLAVNVSGPVYTTCSEVPCLTTTTTLEPTTTTTTETPIVPTTTTTTLAPTTSTTTLAPTTSTTTLASTTSTTTLASTTSTTTLASTTSTTTLEPTTTTTTIEVTTTTTLEPTTTTTTEGVTTSTTTCPIIYMTFVAGGEPGSVMITNNNAFDVKIYDGDTIKGNLLPGANNTWTFTSWKIVVTYGSCTYCYSSSDFESVPCEGTTTTTCAPFSSFAELANANWPTNLTIINNGPTPIDIYDGPVLLQTVGGGANSDPITLPLSGNILTIYNGTCQYCFDVSIDLCPEVSCNTTTTTTTG